MTETRILKSTPYKNTNLSSKVIHALATTKGVTWLDRVRIPYESERDKEEYKGNQIRNTGTTSTFRASPLHTIFQSQGRFPANLLVSGDVLNDGKIRKCKPNRGNDRSLDTQDMGWNFRKVPHNIDDSGSYSRYFDLDKWWEMMIND